jgi:CDP-diacylglycerol--glycerol-3-phosphate 3-phosphatidyltransferase
MAPKPSATAPGRRLAEHLPLALTGLRAALAPVMLLLALRAPIAPAFGTCLALAFVSDVFDGIIARRLGVATPALRRLDSVADTLFYGTATFAVWHLQPAALLARWPALAVLAALEALRYAVDYAKFRREAAYHMWSSKLWGVVLFGAFFALLALGQDNAWVDAAIALGILADLEGLAISAVLPRWRNDVPSLVHALRLRAAQRR